MALTFLLLIFLFCSSFASESEADSFTLKTSLGEIEGLSLKDGKVKAFLGIPYAKPPLGELRFKVVIYLLSNQN